MTAHRQSLLAQLGFRFGLNGPHAARTMMLGDLRLLLAHTAKDAERADYAAAEVDANVLGKATVRDKFFEQHAKRFQHRPFIWHVWGGLNPDLNDGVRLNIRPFMTAEVLRHNKKPKLNITWDKDRGKDVESAPWFGVFGGDRINDHHLTWGEKMAARSRT